jgi:predicted RND superfamily exporter protein
MSKAAGAVIAMFTVGAGMVTLLSSVLGTYAEAATLALVGVGLLAGSSVLSGNKETAPAGVAKEA